MTVLTEADIERIERAVKGDKPFEYGERTSAFRDVLILCAEWRKNQSKEPVVMRSVTDDRCRACEQRRGSHHTITLACPIGSYKKEPIQTFSEKTVFTP